MNRGRIQAQGMGCEKSQPWSQPDVPTKQEGRDKSEVLRSQLNRRELSDRRDCFPRLTRFIEQAPPRGYDVCKRSYTPIPPHEDVRIDVEIIKGKAFRDDNYQ